ncbi:MAG: YbjN domain-containing protein [Propionibacteriaceae bacterium]|jgi:hypothetical protein|nr:YbjN domain-containing protein [Propionibacteriaceae bacterium]
MSDDFGRGVLAPLSRERVEQALQANEWHYQVDSDGDVGGIWDDNVFYFFISGEQNEILNIRGRWHHSLRIEQRAEAREVIDIWHQERLWPKGYTHVDDDGKLRIFAEHVVDWEFGLTDEQLLQTISCALSSSLQLFQHLAEHFGK